jgi:hypothetical protein
VFSSLGVSPSRQELFRPYPNWEDWQIQTVEEAIRFCWQGLITNHAAWLCDADEEKITEKLVENLCYTIQQDPPAVNCFAREFFDTPVREGSLSSYKKKSIKTSPDIVFRLANETRLFSDPQQFAFVIECKIIDSKGSLPDYVNKGVARFFDGTYAHAMNFAGMVGYLRKGTSSLPDTRTMIRQEFERVDKTSKQKQSVRYGLNEGPISCVFTKPADTIQITKHLRKSELGLISIRHLWLRNSN